MKRSINSKYLKCFQSFLGLRFISIGCILLLQFIVSDLYAQSITISGRVSDTDGFLPGITVKVQETNAAASTDAQGNYRIQAPADGTLIFSFIGYTTQSVKINNRTSIDILLKPESKDLNEVVIVGYGVQKKVSMTSAVSEVKGDDLLKRTTNNVQQALQGQVAGLTIQDQGAGPGKSNMTMRVRGTTTIGSNEPLVIVDGIEQRLADLSPDDIESISVLKDASSTSIYGSRGANGVILVTTKRAKAGKVAINYSGYYALQQSTNLPKHMGLEDYMRLQNVAWTNSTGTPIYTEAYIQEYLNATDRLKYPLPNTWFDAMLKVAPQSNHALSISGGSETLTARVSIRTRDQDGIISNSDSKLREVRVNADYKPSKKLSFSSGINYRYTNNLQPINENQVFNYMLQTSQWTVPRYPDGTYGISSDGNSPLVAAELAGTTRTKEDYMFLDLRGEWNIAKGLKLSTQLGQLMTLTNGKSYTNAYTINDYYNPSINRKQVTLNNLTEARGDIRELTINNLLNYSNTFGNHTINVLAGYSQTENKTSNMSAFRQGFYNNDIQSLSQGANDGTKTNTGVESGWGLRSYFGRLNYSYKDKYLLEGNARYDGSSRFIGDNKYSFFPSFSAGWRISQEKFFEGVLGNKISELKLRGSWGQTGNQAVALYSYLPTLNLLNYTFNGSSSPAYLQTNMAYQDITWETTTQANIGMDIQVLDGRLSFTTDYYHKKTTGILLSLPVPGTLGLAASPSNAGRIDNKGWEFMITSRNKFGKLGFDANVTFNINDNKVVDLAGTGPYVVNGFGTESRYITKEGLPYNSFWGYKTDGLFQTAAEIAAYPTMRADIKPGDVKFVDNNGDGKITPDDMVYLGPTTPRYTFGSTLNFSYKSFGLNVLIQGVAAQKTRLGGALVEMGIWGGFTSDNITNNYWTPEHRDARFPRPLKYDLRNINFADRDLENGAYLRLKNVQLSYQLPVELTKKVGIGRASLYVAGTNLLTFSALNQWGVDPETQVGTRAQAYPQTSLYTVGVNVQF